MNQERTDLAALFKRLNGMGVEAADLSPSLMRYYIESGDGLTQADVLRIIGEMMTTDTGDITMSDVLAAAKRAGVY